MRTLLIRMATTLCLLWVNSSAVDWIWGRGWLIVSNRPNEYKLQRLPSYSFNVLMTSILIMSNLSNLLSFTDYPVARLIKWNWSLECVRQSFQAVRTTWDTSFSFCRWVCKVWDWVCLLCCRLIFRTHWRFSVQFTHGTFSGNHHHRAVTVYGIQLWLCYMCNFPSHYLPRYFAV